jgi:hypothetical protein
MNAGDEDFKITSERGGVMRSSHSVLIQEPVEFSPDEKRYLAQFPKEVTDVMTIVESAMLTRLPPKEWPEELRKKVEPYMDLG